MFLAISWKPLVKTAKRQMTKYYTFRALTRLGPSVWVGKIFMSKISGWGPWGSSPPKFISAVPCSHAGTKTYVIWRNEPSTKAMQKPRTSSKSGEETPNISSLNEILIEKWIINGRSDRTDEYSSGPFTNKNRKMRQWTQRLSHIWLIIE
jgi:hypothetical protein